MAVSFSSAFERAVVEAAGFDPAIAQAGSVEISQVWEPNTTVRFVVVASVPSKAVAAAITDELAKIREGAT